MPDITMCKSTLCTVRAMCKRNVESGTQPSLWQSFFAEIPGSDRTCKEFWKVTHKGDGYKWFLNLAG